jgi:hypothetical protein
MPYDLTTFACAPLTEGTVAASACDWIAQAPGRLLGAWRTEIGDLFQVKLLRQFDTADALEEERLAGTEHEAGIGRVFACVGISECSNQHCTRMRRHVQTVGLSRPRAEVELAFEKLK